MHAEDFSFFGCFQLWNNCLVALTKAMSAKIVTSSYKVFNHLSIAFLSKSTMYKEGEEEEEEEEPHQTISFMSSFDYIIDFLKQINQVRRN